MNKVGFALLLLLFLVTTVFLFWLFWNKGLLNNQLPLSRQQREELVKDKGVVRNDFGGETFVLASLPPCKTVDDLYTSEGSPRKKYTLKSKNYSLGEFLFKPVIVWGEVRTEERVLRPPEIVCITAPCEVRTTENIMELERVEIDETPLASCQKTYLERISSQLRRVQ